MILPIKEAADENVLIRIGIKRASGIIAGVGTEDENVGVIFDSITWAANRDRGEAIGYSPGALEKFNTDVCR